MRPSGDARGMSEIWISEPAPAKVNLALHLRRRRADGYHDLETIFAFTAFGDTLHASADTCLSFSIEGEFAGAAGQGADNLVLRAAEALRAAAGVQSGAVLRLEKRIPVAAGLGGGSADAAAALRLLNKLWGLDWSAERLEALAADLGADVPACVRSLSCIGKGRGEILVDWQHEMAGTPLLLINPRVAVPTGPVFKAWDQIDGGGIDPAAPLSALRNDMTAAAISMAPIIGEVLAALAVTDNLVLARMSGSGATCLALYETEDALDVAASRLAGHDWWIEKTALL